MERSRGFKARFAGIRILVALQLRGHFVFAFKTRKKESLTKLFFYVVGIAAMTGLLFLLDYLLGYLSIFGMNPHLPIPLWNMAFFGYLLVSFFSVLFRLNDALFRAKDNAILLSYPLPSQDIFISKIVAFAIQEVLKALLFLLPLLVSIGIIYSVPAGYYFWAVLMTFVIPLFGIAFASILAIPLHHARMTFAKWPLLQSISLLLFLILLTCALFYCVSLIPPKLSIIEKWATDYFPAIIVGCSWITKILYPLALLSTMAIGYAPWGSNMLSSPNPFGLAPALILIAVLLLTIGFFALAAFLAKKRFPALAIQAQEYGKKEKRKTHVSNRRLPRFLSHIKRELLQNTRDYRSVSGYYLLFIVTPLAILLLNAVFKAMSKSFTGEILTLFFNGLIMALIAFATNVSVASVYSREGQAGLLTHSFPEGRLYAFLSRIILRAGVMTISLVFTFIVYGNMRTYGVVTVFPLFLCLYLIYLGHLLWSAELDYMNPKFSLYEDTGNKSTLNLNELKSLVLAFIFAFLFAGLLLLFVYENGGDGIYHLLVFAVLFFAARVFLFVHKVRSYGLLRYEGRGGR